LGGAGRVTEIDMGQLDSAEPLCKRPPSEEDGAKMCAPFSIAVVASIRTMVIHSGLNLSE